MKHGEADSLEECLQDFLGNTHINFFLKANFQMYIDTLRSLYHNLY